MSQFGNGWGSYGGAPGGGAGAPPPPHPQHAHQPYQPGFGAPGAQPPVGAMVPYAQPMPLAVWGCRWCGYQGAPMYRRKVSGAGIAVTIALAVVFLPLFWIGLLMKETVPQCPSCGR